MIDAPFELRISQVADATVIEVIGEVDMATAPQLASAIDSVLGNGSRVVVNLYNVTFLDSSGLNALVHAQRELARREVAFRIVSPADRNVRRVFEITHLTGPLSVVGSLEEALT